MAGRFGIDLTGNPQVNYILIQTQDGVIVNVNSCTAGLLESNLSQAGINLIRHYFESYFKKKSKQFSPDPSELVQEFNRIASGLKTGFCSSKDVSMFYDLLKKREYEDIDGLINVILANIQHSSKKELNEFYMVLKKLLEAKTPDGKFIFGISIVSDSTSKQMLSGIENILDAKRNNFALYEQYLKLLELSEKGS